MFLSLSVVSTSDLSDIDEDSSSSDGSILSVEDDSQSESVDDKANSGSDKISADDSQTDDDSSGDFPDCNLTISKEGDKKVKEGDEVEWNITVNNSLNTAYNVVVEEKLPKNFELVSAKASKGTYNEEMGYWEIGDLKKSESATLIIKAKAKKTGNYTNTVDLFTDSNNLNKNTTVKADVEVVSEDKSKAAVKKNEDKKENLTEKVETDKEENKTNNTQTNDTNQSNNEITLENAGNPIIVLLISFLVVLGLGIFKKQ